MRERECRHAGSLFVERGENGLVRIRCGWCWELGPVRKGSGDAIRAFREMEAHKPKEAA
jgi:hypothetical protein